ncbi:Hexosyltransferase, partial [Fasciolopsis buskii]
SPTPLVSSSICFYPHPLLFQLNQSSKKFRRAVWCSVALILVVLYYAYEFTASDDLAKYPLDVNLTQMYEQYSMIPNWVPSIYGIDPASFPRLRAPTHLCSAVRQSVAGSETILDVLLVIKTRVNSFDQRRSIRNTWGNSSCAPNGRARIRTIFVLGRAASMTTPSLESKLQMEQEHYNDLLQFDFVDTYRNNTYKVMTALDYVSRKCNNTNFVILVDDDFLVNPNTLIQAISKVNAVEYSTYVSGQILFTHQPERTPWSKWFVHYWEYPYRVFPPYPSGGTVIMSMPVVRLVAFGMRFVQFFWIDDVYLGIVLNKFGIIPQTLPGVYLKPVVTGSELFGMISSHGFGNPAKMEQGWKRLLRAGVCAT